MEIERSTQPPSKDARVKQLLDQLKASASHLVDLIATERNYEPHQALLQRLRLPVTPTMTAEDVREVIQRDFKIASEADFDVDFA